MAKAQIDLMGVGGSNIDENTIVAYAPAISTPTTSRAIEFVMAKSAQITVNQYFYNTDLSTPSWQPISYYFLLNVDGTVIANSGQTSITANVTAGQKVTISGNNGGNAYERKWEITF